MYFKMFQKPAPYREYTSRSFVNEYERTHALKSMRSKAKRCICTLRCFKNLPPKNPTKVTMSRRSVVVFTLVTDTDDCEFEGLFMVQRDTK